MYINKNGVMRFECIDCNQMRWNEKIGHEVECDYDACDRIEYLSRDGDL